MDSTILNSPAESPAKNKNDIKIDNNNNGNFKFCHVKNVNEKNRSFVNSFIDMLKLNRKENSKSNPIEIRENIVLNGNCNLNNINKNPTKLAVYNNYNTELKPKRNTLNLSTTGTLSKQDRLKLKLQHQQHQLQQKQQLQQHKLSLLNECRMSGSFSEPSLNDLLNNNIFQQLDISQIPQCNLNPQKYCINNSKIMEQENADKKLTAIKLKNISKTKNTQTNEILKNLEHKNSENTLEKNENREPHQSSLEQQSSAASQQAINQHLQHQQLFQPQLQSFQHPQLHYLPRNNPVPLVPMCMTQQYRKHFLISTRPHFELQNERKNFHQISHKKEKHSKIKSINSNLRNLFNKSKDEKATNNDNDVINHVFPTLSQSAIASHYSIEKNKLNDQNKSNRNDKSLKQNNIMGQNATFNAAFHSNPMNHSYLITNDLNLNRYTKLHLDNPMSGYGSTMERSFNSGYAESIGSNGYRSGYEDIMVLSGGSYKVLEPADKTSIISKDLVVTNSVGSCVQTFVKNHDFIGKNLIIENPHHFQTKNRNSFNEMSNNNTLHENFGNKHNYEATSDDRNSSTNSPMLVTIPKQLAAFEGMLSNKTPIANIRLTPDKVSSQSTTNHSISKTLVAERQCVVPSSSNNSHSNNPLKNNSLLNKKTTSSLKSNDKSFSSTATSNSLESSNLSNSFKTTVTTSTATTTLASTNHSSPTRSHSFDHPTYSSSLEDSLEYDDFQCQLPGSYFTMDPLAYTLTWSKSPAYRKKGQKSRDEYEFWNNRELKLNYEMKRKDKNEEKSDAQDYELIKEKL